MLLILNVLKVLLGSVFNKLYPFLILNLVALTIGAEAAGGYALFISISGAAAIFITGGVGPVLVRYLAAPVEVDCVSKKSVIDFSVFSSAVIVIFLSALIYILVSRVLTIDIPSVSSDLFAVLVVAFLVGQSIVSLTKSALLGLRKYNTLMFYELVLTIINLGGLVVAFFYFGLSSLDVYLGLSALLSLINGLLSVALVVHIRSRVVERSDPDLSLLIIKRFVCFGVPSLANAIMFTPVLLVGKFFLEHYHGLAAVGQFELAFQWATMVLIVTGVVSGLALPELAVHLNSYSKLKATYFQYLLLNVGISLCLGSLLVLFFYLNRSGVFDFFSVVHQIDYAVLFLALITALLISIWSVQTKVFAVYERQFWVTSLNLIWAILCGALAVIFVPEYGALGLMTSITASWLALVLVFFWFNYRFMSAKNEIPSV